MLHLRKRFQAPTPRSDSTNLSVVYSICIYPSRNIDHYTLVEIPGTSQASCMGSPS